MGIDIRGSHTVEVGYDEFCGALAATGPAGAVEDRQDALMPEVPIPTTRPWLWRWDDVLPLAKRAGEMITLERGGDRRVLAFANPGLNGLPFTSTTLWGAYQYLGPGENAPAHRHTASAIRFVVAAQVPTRPSTATPAIWRRGTSCLLRTGTGTITTTTATSRWSGSTGWISPSTTTLESIFFENHPDSRQSVAAHNLSGDLFGGAGLAPSWARPPQPATRRFCATAGRRRTAPWKRSIARAAGRSPVSSTRTRSAVHRWCRRSPVR